jgi:formylglycine-generating enzyme required for sulfatase activity
MLTGLMPDADGIPEVLMKNPDLPPAFEALYRRALNANPLARPKSAGEFAAEFSSIVAKGPAAMKRPSRQMPALGSSALTSTARNAEKPPPPVPTDQLPIASVSPPVVARPPAKEEEPPVDATQPMDAAMLEAIMAAPPVSAAKPDGTGKPSDTRPPADGRSGRTSLGEPPPPPVPAANLPRAPGTAAPAPRQPVKPGVAARSGKKVEKRPMPIIWLVLLTLVGLMIGSAVGYVVLKHLGAGQQGGSLPVTPPGSTLGPLTAPPVPAEADPMAPTSRCPQGMKLVSGGTFKRGADPTDTDKLSDERLLESVEVPTFCIDEYEYPNQSGAVPRVNVNWAEAQQTCQKKNKRLCTEEEWEKACKGPGNARFPYGNDFDASRCNADDGSGQARTLAESGRFQECRSAYKVADLSGNVAEWTASTFAGGSENKTQKGGAFDKTRYAVRCSARISGVPTEQKPNVGFRCCAGVQP